MAKKIEYKKKLYMFGLLENMEKIKSVINRSKKTLL